MAPEVGTTTNRAGKPRKPKKKKSEQPDTSQFQFVNALPTTACDKETLRLAVRANATRYQWRHGREVASSTAAESFSPDLPSLSKSPLETQQGGSDPVGTWFDDVDEVSELDPSTLTQITPEEDFWNRRGSESITGSDSSICRLASKEPTSHSPVTLLSAGHSDPFHMYPSHLPVDLLGRLLHHCVLYTPRLFPITLHGRENRAVVQWHSRVMSNNKALFHAFMYGAAVHIYALRGQFTGQGTPETLATYTEAIRHLNKEMKNASTACTDENILAVVCLAHNGWSSSARKPAKSPSQAPLKELQMLAVYGTLETIMAHAEGLAKLVELRGGLENIQMAGLAEIISYAGIIGASRFLTKPIYPFISNLKDTIFPIFRAADLARDGTHPLDTLGTGFDLLWSTSHCTIIQTLLTLIRHMSAYTRIIDDYCQGRVMPLSLSALMDQRNFVQHALMSLPTAGDFVTTAEAVDALYEPCRLALVIYSFLNVFPLPPASAPFPELSLLLRSELLGLNSNNAWTRAPGLLLWILFMGGIAAIDSSERSWFVLAIDRHVTRNYIPDWEAAQEKLQSFLWLGSTSDVDGQALWSEVKN